MERFGAVFRKEERGSDELFDPIFALDGRYVHLDVTRICCIVCVVLHSFDQRLARWNTLYAHNWVIQLLWVISGICFCLSRRPLAHFIGRLAVYFMIGAIMNWAAWVINGWHWTDNIFIMLHQMNFVLSLIVICLVLVPLRRRLRSAASEGDPEQEVPEVVQPATNTGDVIKASLVVAGGLAAIVVAFVFGLSHVIIWACGRLSRVPGLGVPGGEDWAWDLSCNLQTCIAGLWILLAFVRLFPQRSLAAWLLIANLYAHRVCSNYGSPDFFFHGFYLVMIAMTVHELGLWRRRFVGKVVHRYWLVVCFLCCFLWTPGLNGDLMSRPPLDPYVAKRYILIEAVLVVAWLTAGELMVDPKIFSEDKLGWVNEWTLLLFLSHQSVQWLLPWPVDVAVLLAIGPVAWVFRTRM